MKKPLLVVDTNIFINSIFGRNRFKDDMRILEYEESGFVRFAFSQHTKNELYKIMSRFIEKEDIFECSEFFELLYKAIDRSVFIKHPAKLTDELCKDKGDLPFLELAVSANADYLITNDHKNGLLDIGSYSGVQIVTPKEFVKVYNKERRNIKYIR